jgi:arsenate reductase (glutaredoxin)
LLDAEKVPHRYRDYRQEPLGEEELRSVLRRLGVGPREVLRRNDQAFRDLGLTGEEDDATLIALMAEHPTLLQRPIGVLGNRAVVGRPPERLLDLAGGG